MQGSFENGDGVSFFQSSLKLTARLSDTLIRVQFTLMSVQMMNYPILLWMPLQTFFHTNQYLNELITFKLELNFQSGIM